jgi:hypothetical protein
MLNKVSVMDLRFIQSLQDKQFFVTEVLSALYFHLIKMGGSEKLRYILYVDELAGLLPPPPAIPPCKKMLELLIRQARAFGLGVVIATQSPGDIDYRIFSNVGTRFIGRLRTEIEMSKVAAAMSLSPGEMMPIISKLSTGEFVYNDAVKNSRKVISARWLVTYHGGPLKDEEIRWVNNPNEISKPIKKLKVVKFTPKKKKVHEVEESISKSRAYLKKGKKHEKRTVKSGLNTILDKIKRYADKVQTKIVHTKAEQYVPHLRIVITPKEINGIEFDMQGPYIFDLTSKMIPLGNYLSHVTWSTIVNPNVKIKKAKMSIQKAFDYAVYDACSKLKKRYYTSSIIKYASISRNDVVVKNKQELESKVEHRLKVLQLKTQRQINRIDNSIDENNKKIGKYLLILNYKKTHGFLKKIFLKKAAPKTKRMRQIERIYAKLWSENKVLRSKMNKLEKEYVDKSKKILQKITIDANTHVKERIYVPKRKNMLISSTLLLVAKDKSEV